MQCTVKHRRCSSLDNVDVEQQQQSLFDVSVFKLQHEQVRHGVDPRLLRFVLINNALRSLQGHMIHFDDDECLGDGSGSGDSSDQFFFNTFKNGSLSSIPLSPPTPVKTMKTDCVFSDQSPLVEFHEASPCSSSMQDDVVTSLCEERVQPAARLDAVVCEVGRGECDGGEVEGMEGGAGKEKRPPNGLTDVHGFGVHLGKRSREKFVEDLDIVGRKDHSRSHPLDSEGVGLEGKDSVSLGIGGGGESKRLCKSPGVQKGLNALNNLYVALELDPLPPPILPSSPTSLTPTHYHHNTHQSHTEESDKDSLTPSPIDFANVDPSIYDFDTAVLTVGTTEGRGGGGELNSHSPQLLPSHITITASTSCTSYSSTSTVLHPSTPSLSPSCSPIDCPLAVTAPLSSLHFPSLTCSSMPMQSSQLNGSVEDSDIAVMSEPHSEVEKLSLLSADSMVLAAMPIGSPTTTKGTSCSMEALVHNGELGLDTGEEHSGDPRDSIGGGSRGALPSSPEPGIELDCTLDDIEHIVNLLMT